MESLSGNQVKDLKELYASIYKSDDQEISETTAALQGLSKSNLEAMKGEKKEKINVEDEKKKPITINLPNGGTTKIYPGSPNYEKAKNKEDFSIDSSGERGKINVTKNDSGEVKGKVEIKTGSGDSVEKIEKDTKDDLEKNTNPSGKIIPKPTKPLMTNSPAAKAGIPLDMRQKFANQNAAFQATKKKDSGYTKMDFIKDFPNSQTAKKYRKGEPIPGFKYKKNLKSSYEYDTHKGLNEMGPEGLIPKDSFSEKPKPKEKEKPVRKPSNLGAASLIPPESFKKEELEELTPYDIVLEYLLYTEQVATIEEANYVMTEMDGKTINDIVKEVTQSLEEGIGSVRILPALGKMALGAAAVKGISSYLGKKSGESSIKGSQQMKGGDPIRDLIPNLKKKKEATEKAIEKM